MQKNNLPNFFKNLSKNTKVTQIPSPASARDVFRSPNYFFFDSLQWRIQDFPQRGAPTSKIAIIFQIFAENCMKMKKFGPPGGASLAPPWICQWSVQVSVTSSSELSWNNLHAVRPKTRGCNCFAFQGLFWQRVCRFTGTETRSRVWLVWIC